MALAAYHAKRDFRRTPEPRGRVGQKKAKGLAYLIQKHAASHLHYDLRLELDGVLLSWAVPKGPSFDPADKRLAVHVEDHPVEYGSFEGTIPKGHYGGGTVMLWDQGLWIPHGDARASLKKGHLKFDLEGKKLKGTWALIKTRGNKYGGKGEPWLLIKDKDAYSKRGVSARIVDSDPDSVVSGRSMDEIEAAADREWHSNRSVTANLNAAENVKKKVVSRKAGAAIRPFVDLHNIAGAKRGSIAKKLKPMLATLVKDAPQGDDWVHEVKYDGYRMVTRLNNGTVHMYTRNGNDWTSKFSDIARQVGRLSARSAWIDGEVCAVDADGRPDFQSLQNAISGEARPQLMYFVFDLIYLNGYDLTNARLADRKQLLQRLLEESDTELRYSPDVQGSGSSVFRKICPSGYEGIVSKRADSTYAIAARTKNWVKVKCSMRQEMVIGGFSDPQGSRKGFGALLLGYYSNNDLQYAGKVGTGFNDKTLAVLLRKLKPLEQNTPPFVNPPGGVVAKGTHWVKPKLVGEIQFTEWSDSGALRHPSFMGLRDDKKATEVVREKALPVTADRIQRSAPLRAKVAKKDDKPPTSDLNMNSVTGVKLTNPNKLMFPEAKITKLGLARYYESIASWIIPHIAQRPLSMYRCPDGWAKECFYQKHADKSVHPSVSRVQVPEGDGKARYFSANSLQALVSLVQWGVIEFHPWGARMPKPGRPDRLIFDFDPDEGVSWAELAQGVEDLRILLSQLGLEGFLKTTGGKGLHVVVPIQPTLTWVQAKAFTKAIADLFARTFPDRFLATVSKAKRKDKIFIDYLRNAEGATAIAAYGVRARKNAPVSTPIGWDELAKDIRFDFFNVKTIPKRLQKLQRDPWEKLVSTRQTITARMFKQVGAQLSRL